MHGRVGQALVIVTIQDSSLNESYTMLITYQKIIHLSDNMTLRNQFTED